MLLNLRTKLPTCNFILKEFTMRGKHNLSRDSSRRRRRVNPGIDLRANLLNEKDKDLEELDLEELEADFANVNLSHRQHEQQMKLLKEREKYLVIKQKYFKERTPNFLTWSDKLQMRHLHSVDPEQWTVEKLSEGFPALPDTITNIVKGNWMKKSKRLKNHDTAVVSNWSSFKKGEMPNLPSHLVEHLKKFTGRELNLTPYDVYEDEKPAVKNVEGEFSEIITSYERIKDKSKYLCENTNVNDNEGERKPKRETYLSNVETPESHERVKHQKHITLSHLRKELEDKSENDVDDQFLLQKLQEKQENLVKPENPVIEVTINDDSKMKSAHKPDKKNYNHLIYPEKITISRNKYKSGYTYKLNDCYYDSDGLFLYRVPGMDK